MCFTPTGIHPIEEMIQGYIERQHFDESGINMSTSHRIAMLLSSNVKVILTDNDRLVVSIRDTKQ